MKGGGKKKRVSGDEMDGINTMDMNQGGFQEMVRHRKPAKIFAIMGLKLSIELDD